MADASPTMNKHILPLEGVLLNDEIEHPWGEGCEALSGWYSVRRITNELFWVPLRRKLRE